MSTDTESRGHWKLKNLLRRHSVTPAQSAVPIPVKAPVRVTNGASRGTSETVNLKANARSGVSANSNTGRPTSVNASASGTSDSSQSTPSTTLNNCRCCGTLLAYQSKSVKFRCSVCNTTSILAKYKAPSGSSPPPVLSYQYIKSLVDDCLRSVHEINPTHISTREEAGVQSATPEHAQSIHEIFEPLSKTLFKCFKSHECLNLSFQVQKSSRPHYSRSNINLAEVRESFDLLLRLPTKRPLYNALCGAHESTRRVYSDNENDPRSLAWIFILLEIPFLSRSLTESSKMDQNGRKKMYDCVEIRNLSYDILKRCIGVLSQLATPTNTNYFASWFSKLSAEEFINKLDMLNLYITFHLRKYLYLANTKTKTMAAGTSNEYLDNLPMKEDEDDVENSIYSPQIFSMLKKQKQSVKIRIHQYGNDWHIRTCLMVLSIFWRANTIREERVAVSCFYNSLVDYVNMKLDFDAWQQYSRKEAVKGSQYPTADIQEVLQYIHGKATPPAASYFICQYPFLISLGGKISVLEYEAKRQMERKAEEAFINSLDKRIAIDVYFRVKVRREFIVQDSLSAIRFSSEGSLKKSLRVQFIGEPGIDAGGLKKEWFFLLTKAIFSPQTGMLYNVEDSNYLWFNIKPIENFEMYYLFGSILGLAIYNSTILDLKFPMATYKLLLGKSLGVEDYKEIFPVAYNNLMKLQSMSSEDLCAMGLTMEVSHADIFGEVSTSELCPNGSHIEVNVDNLDIYIKSYWSFFLKEGVSKQITAFHDGFLNVVGGNGLSIFSPDEIRLLLCGNEETDIDVDILKSVCKYVGWDSPEQAGHSQIMSWFWRHVSSLSLRAKKKLLVFITGSDRVPATGIQNLNLKISLLDHGRDSNRLPLAHTCFNELAIYNYSSYGKLVDKLTQAVNESEGFGIK